MTVVINYGKQFQLSCCGHKSCIYIEFNCKVKRDLISELGTSNTWRLRRSDIENSLSPLSAVLYSRKEGSESSPCVNN